METPKIKSVNQLVDSLEPILTQADLYEKDNGYKSLVRARDITKAVIAQDRASLHTSLVAAVEGIEEYMEAKDNSSHRYEIPRSKKKEWEAFCDIPEDDERSWDVPEWANRIDGMPVRSIKEQVLTIINSIFKE